MPKMAVYGSKMDLGPSPVDTRAGAWLAWSSYDIGQRPFNFLILTYIFAPYFAATLYADPVRGQAVWGLTVAFAGIMIALLGPPLGAIADAAGPKKPWIAVFGAMLAAGSAMLWWAQPGTSYAAPLAVTGVIVATIGSELSIVFHNALLPLLARPEQVGRLSALGWALGIVGGVATLIIVLFGFAIDPRTGLTLPGWPPLFTFELAESTSGRVVGPLVAVWFVAFVIPMFLWMPDDRRSDKPLVSMVGQGLKNLRATLTEVRKDKKTSTFLIAYLLYSDGLITLIAFGGVYAAGLLDWGPIQLAGLGLALGVAGAPVVLLTGRLDDRFGPQFVVTFCIILLSIATIGILAVDRNGVFGLHFEGIHGGHFFLLFAILIGISGAPLQSSSRSLMAHLAPRDRVAQMFGLFAMAGRATSFAGPALVGLITAATGSQRIGFSVALLFLIAGALLMIRFNRLAK